MDYIELLHEELNDAKRRLEKASPEGRRVIKRQIRQIERDIQRNSKKNDFDVLVVPITKIT